MLDYLAEYRKRSAELSAMRNEEHDLNYKADKLRLKYGISIGYSGILEGLKHDVKKSIAEKMGLSFYRIISDKVKIPYSLVKKVILSKPYADIFRDVCKFTSTGYYTKEEMLEKEVLLLQFLYMRVLANKVIDYLERNEIDLNKLHYKRFERKFNVVFPDCYFRRSNESSLYLVYKPFTYKHDEIDILNCGKLFRPKVYDVDDIAGAVEKYLDTKITIRNKVESFEKEISDLKASCFYSVFNPYESSRTIFY